MVLSLVEAERRGVVMTRVPSSCEWDGCDRQTAALRWSHAQGGYLAACLPHATAREEADETQTPRRTPNGEPRTADRATGRRTGQPEAWRMVGRGAGRVARARRWSTRIWCRRWRN